MSGLHRIVFDTSTLVSAALVRKHAVLVAVSATDEFNVVPQCRDPKDNQFLALVLACEADALVSSDADLLVLHPWRGVPIVTPGDFLDMS